jgi:periplasmic protein TonB
MKKNMQRLNKLFFFCIIIFPSLSMAQCDSIDYYFGKDTEVFAGPEEMPQFPGGDKARIAFLKENIKLPDNWPPDSITGKVFITFLVDLEGNIKFPCILRGLNPILDSIAIATIRKMPKWTPAKQSGVPVRVQFNLPINFDQYHKEKK